MDVCGSIVEGVIFKSAEGGFLVVFFSELCACRSVNPILYQCWL